jgi:hypothetical protein
VEKRIFKLAAITVLLTFSSTAFTQTNQTPPPAAESSEAAMSSTELANTEVSNPPIADSMDDDNDVDDSTPQGKPVGKASEDGAKQAKRKMWGNIALAVSAVIVAVVALIVVSNNNGHSSK